MCFHSKVLFLTVLLVPVLAQADAPNSDLCKYVSAYKKPDGVEYQPGVDAYGKTVVPADLNQSDNSTYEDIVIPVEIDLIHRYNLMAPAGMELKPVVADMTIHKNGHVDYNGHDLTDEAVAFCNEKATAAPETPSLPPHGQGDSDDLSSAPVQGKLIEGHSP